MVLHFTRPKVHRLQGPHNSLPPLILGVWTFTEDGSPHTPGSSTQRWATTRLHPTLLSRVFSIHRTLKRYEAPRRNPRPPAWVSTLLQDQFLGWRKLVLPLLSLLLARTSARAKGSLELPQSLLFRRPPLQSRLLNWNQWGSAYTI